MTTTRHRELTEQEIARVVAAPGVLEAFLGLVDRLGADEVSLRSVERTYWRAHRGRVRHECGRSPDWRDPAVVRLLRSPLPDAEVARSIMLGFRVLVRAGQVRLARRRLVERGDAGAARTVPLTEPVLAVIRREGLTNPERARQIGLLTGHTPTAARVSQLRRTEGIR